ncbi:hypothetical protein N4562_05660 [Ligilactobacillus agilis]|uniref:Uncharacterized protein n=1 Tax=Ligilactobacillus agilis TaxID=1601 RepID=A0A9Q9MS23_9LACO|nr:hypothetical protein [Ligilactobacillus agilis]MDO4597838.1 hypothetical protein [Ligilactobacillus agilis]MDY4064867.1 hypothetical protein [Ligilactobacillus agilis]UXC62597.1 hypothetical protein N4562_05660 [Ligilactobacillus agilis]UXC64598.1 hypothetical protein N4597_05665 [Ligilactobacillus agilis]
MFENKQRPTWMDIDDTDCLSPKEEKQLRKKIAEREKNDPELRRRLKEFDDYVKENYLK